jgi:hypothetical protein
MKKRIIVLSLITIGVIGLTGCTENFKREMKTMSSDWTGGLNRTVTVYDYNGEEIGSWTGKFDVSSNDQETFFDVNGKRVIIQGGIIVNEEN